MVLVDDIEAAVGRAIQFLLAEQRPSGEFPSVAAFLGDDPDWEDDTLTFVTALVTLALERVDDERALEMMRGARSFLEREREPGGQWRYWSHDHPRHDFTPPDADDTACASMALERSGTSTRENVPLLLANRDRAGRFYTWLVLHRPWPRSPRVWWGLRRELAGRRRRAELWDTTEAEFDDVDGVVNANVVRYLGDDAPPAAAAYVAELVEQD
ncbi:MAG TPA: prenyltransferase/squalene oxidase repeat-containing protein, partial [Acidimicrobiales bacterium]|nr:prenyltransferase/squalene oxidase repeat-containing protein [Acidimicrobiales bacterium]